MIKVLYVVAFHGMMLVILSGCGGLSIAEHQDAETIGKNKWGILSGGSGGPEETKEPFVKAITPTLMEQRLLYGVSDRLNISGSVWSGRIVSRMLSKLFLDVDIRQVDWGFRGMAKYRITGDESKIQMAVLLNATRYYVRREGEPNLVATGWSPGIVVSRPVGRSTALYGITKLNLFDFNAYKDDDTSRSNRLFYSIHLGASERFKKTKGFFEVIYSRVPKPLSLDSPAHVFSVGLGYMWNLGH